MHQAYIISFSIGFFGSMHCIGMCGGLVSALGMSRPRIWWTGLTAYQTGRVLTYSLMGVVAGLFGTSLKQLSGLGLLQFALAVVAGLMMIGMGLNLTGWIPDPLARLAARLTRVPALAQKFSHATRSSTLASWFAAGMANGLLPCGLVYAALSLALASGGIWQSASLMTAFGLGTVPAMLLTPAIIRSLTPERRSSLTKGVGVLLVLLGLLTMFRGSNWIGQMHANGTGHTHAAER